jgi:hypothetical protein
VQCHLADTSGLASWFEAQAEALDSALAEWGEPPAEPQRLDVDGRVRWSFSLSAAGAKKAVQQGLPLSRQLGITVNHPEAVVSVAAELTPADDQASVIFALDHAVNEVLAVPVTQLTVGDLADAAATASAMNDCTPSTYPRLAARRKSSYRGWRRRASMARQCVVLLKSTNSV